MTNHTDYDVLWPSGSGSELVYEAGGSVYRLDAQTGRALSAPRDINRYATGSGRVWIGANAVIHRDIPNNAIAVLDPGFQIVSFKGNRRGAALRKAS